MTDLSSEIEFEDNTPKDTETSGWTLSQSRELYGVDRWGLGYFGIDDSGDVTVNAPTASGQKSVTLTSVIDGLRHRGLEMPVMLRVENLIDDRVLQLNRAFATAIESNGYQNDYRAVFPIKVNQQHHVVDSIGRSGEPFCHGLEAGSKAELLVAISSASNFQSLIVCNGYKDKEFIDLGFAARELGYRCFFVIETLEELDLVIERSKHFGVSPLIGARLKLATQVEGHWAGDSGDRSLFGLTTVELIAVVDRLKQHGMLDCFVMLHFHLGSQLTNIRNVRDGVEEACRFYIGLIQDGAPLGYFDLGGGLAVDYDGSNSTLPHSRNYGLEEYAADIVETVMTSLDAHQIPHPVLVTESGRWTVAPMSVLIFNVLAVTNFEPDPLLDDMPDDLCVPIQMMLETYRNIDSRRLQENYNDTVYYRDQVRSLFNAGEVSLRERAWGENLYLKAINEISHRSKQLKRPSNELVQLTESLSDIYYGNFSVFQSLPDAWAIEQVFPVMPLHRHQEQPTRRAIVADLTCDCDGKIDRFIGPDGQVERTIRLHSLQSDQPYYVGVFMVGAYQETLGDLHNLFGDNNVASIRVTQTGEVEFVEEITGDTIAQVLTYVEYDPQGLLAKFRQQAEVAVRAQQISVQTRQRIVQLFRQSLQGYTYFEK